MTAVSSRIFISYRRDDSGGYAGRLFDQLSARFGSQVFRDVDGLDLGVDFEQAIEESVGSAAVLIAVIGPDWAGADEAGHRRLDEPNDWVRLEVGGALRRNIRVIPVLVARAAIPTDLPEDLAPLAHRQSLTISDDNWRSGAERLIAAIEKELGSTLPLSPVVLPLALVGAGLLALGPFLRWDSGGHSFVDNNFGDTLSYGGAFTSLAPFGIVVCAVLGALLARKEGTRAVGAGVLIGAGVAGAVKYLRVLQAGHDRSAGVTIGVLAALVGGALVLAAGFVALRATREVASERNVAAAVSGLAGAVLLIVATVIPFNGGGAGGDSQKVTRKFEEAFDPIVVTLAIAVIAFLLLARWRHAELSAALLTLGLLAGLLWVRYLGVPMLQDSNVGSFAPGGLVGLAGAGLVVLAGYLGLRGSGQGVPVAAPAGT